MQAEGLNVLSCFDGLSGGQLALEMIVNLVDSRPKDVLFMMNSLREMQDGIA